MEVVSFRAALRRGIPEMIHFQCSIIGILRSLRSLRISMMPTTQFKKEQLTNGQLKVVSDY
jgi:hypothetical protein